MTVDMAGLTPQTRAWWYQLKQAAADRGYTLRERSARRTCAQQAELYSIGRSAGDTRKVVTGAPGCRSWHVTGNAVDFDVILPNGQVSWSRGDYAAIGALAKEMGGKWGGDFANLDDVGHVEYHPGTTIEEVCPDPNHCVDVQATFDDPVTGLPTWAKVALGFVVVAGAASAGVGLARRQRQ
jgi:hypothetical protein